MNAETLPALAGQVEPSVRPDDEACECREGDGQGGYDAWKAVAGHDQGGEYFRVECDHCDGTGKVDDYGNPFSGDRIIYCCFPGAGAMARGVSVSRKRGQRVRAFAEHRAIRN